MSLVHEALILTSRALLSIFDLLHVNHLWTYPRLETYRSMVFRCPDGSAILVYFSMPSFAPRPGCMFHVKH